ncbi:small wing phospholipase C gamma 1 [Oratosquilla oratoria]|uniref:small wing phospholipase C gamma 1 n=1 Tax=Oratosquilla oratoria TaxID=337810 RepID=UPI003F7638DF
MDEFVKLRITKSNSPTEGTEVTRFFSKQDPESGILKLRDQSGQIVWNDKEVITTIRQIRRINIGRQSKDFEKNESLTRFYGEHCCFILYYGSEFEYQTLSVAAKDEEICNKWYKELMKLMKKSETEIYSSHLEKILRQEFCLYDCNCNSIPPQRANQILTGMNMKPRFTKTKVRNVSFDDFFKEVKASIEEDLFSIWCRNLNEASLIDKYGSGRKTIPIERFKNFLVLEQKDDENAGLEYMRSLPWDMKRVENKELSHLEFIFYLFSKSNELWDKSHKSQSMSQPMHHYWISSSHNTYLTGRQFGGNSSVDAYVEVLCQGCRSVEIDCWDGKNGQPEVTHGRTLTSSIKFKDVIKAIKDYGFATSEYPLILSIEDHCSIAQQTLMAQILKDILGDYLLQGPLNLPSPTMPSPEQLKMKVLIKHKKCGGYDRTLMSSIVSAAPEGIEDWWLYKCSFYDGKVYFNCLDQKIQSKDLYTIPYEVQYEKERHVEEQWFHKKIFEDRGEVERLMLKYLHLGTGTFLVRPALKWPDKFTLSLLCKGKVYHFRIYSNTINNEKVYTFNSSYSEEEPANLDMGYFTSIYSLITFYQGHYFTYKTKEEEVIDVMLQNGVPQEDFHRSMKWYHHDMTNNISRLVLESISNEGAFLVRPSSQGQSSFTLLLRANGKVQKLGIQGETDGFYIWDTDLPFPTLVDIVKYYMHRPLTKTGVCLAVPVTEEHVQIALEKYVAQQDDDAQNSLGSSMAYNIQPKEKVKEDYFSLYGANGIDIKYLLTRTEYNSSRYIIRLRIEKSDEVIHLGRLQFDSLDEASLWLSNYNEASNRKSTLNQDEKIAKEISDLVNYFEPSPYKLTNNFRQVTSFNEVQADKIDDQEMLKFHMESFSRIYPHWSRVASANYNPVPLWNKGCQLVSLNYQIDDVPMQLYEARFLQNHRCGYVLRPELHWNPFFDGRNMNAMRELPSHVFQIKLIAGLLHVKIDKKGWTPRIEIEIIGCRFDSDKKCIGGFVAGSKGNPVWCEWVYFRVYDPASALLRFSVYNLDPGQGSMIGQATYPLTCIREGYRSVPLKNGFSQELEMATLLVKMKTSFCQSI